MTEDIAENSGIQEVSWNLSSALIIEIATLLQRANTFWLHGNITKAFCTLMACKNRMIHDLNPDERKQFKDYETQIIHAIVKKKDGSMEGFDKYNELLMDKLQKYGYTIPKLKDKSRITG